MNTPPVPQPQIQDGFVHWRLTSPEEFKPIAEDFSQDLGWIFRGHAQSDWRLETSLDRLLARIQPKDINLDSTYKFQLKLFAQAIRGRTNASKDVDTNQDELWALGQHHGLATPLLDWTCSLYVALFFAFIDPDSPPCGYRSVWALHRGIIYKEMSQYNEGLPYDQQFSFVDPLTDCNARLVSQSGVFTRQPLSFDIVEWVKQSFRGLGERRLCKIDIPNSDRLGILRHLRQMNIHSGSLFPDVAGASLSCNETLELLADQRKRAPF